MWLGVGAPCVQGKGGSQRIIGNDLHWGMTVKKAFEVEQTAIRLNRPGSVLRTTCVRVVERAGPSQGLAWRGGSYGKSFVRAFNFDIQRPDTR